MSKCKSAVAANLMFAPAVAAMRMPILSREAGGLGLPTETIRAATEKAQAFTEGAFAAQMAYANAVWSFWPEVMTGRKPSLLSGKATEAAIHAALRPASKRVRANYKRLSSKS